MGGLQAFGIHMLMLGKLTEQLEMWHVIGIINIRKMCNSWWTLASMLIDFPSHGQDLSQESNHMLHYTIMIILRHLKMSMEDGRDFAEYAKVCFREFGDRASFWTTINEPNAFMLGGYDLGFLPPQRCSPPYRYCSRGNSSSELYIAALNILLAHASAARLYKKNYQHETKHDNDRSLWLHVPYLWNTCGIAGNNQEYFHRLIISISMVNQWFLNGQQMQRNSTLNDIARVNFMHAYIRGVLDALSYGINYADLGDPDLKRYPKLSAKWYSKFLKGRSINFDEDIELEKNTSSISFSLSVGSVQIMGQLCYVAYDFMRIENQNVHSAIIGSPIQPFGLSLYGYRVLLLT
ncbi:hypothetical protein SO802_033209 [Lithocarpus litseifolius]|uniref:Uncharacterized protein n=1 Tax=Lithocarpus litseifolius TaxID=425828 RepID=A0AAW2BFB5_9ROSI